MPNNLSNVELIVTLSIRPALALLGEKFCSEDAVALMVAIGLQESRFTHRNQVGGPARGYWQFERGGGVHGVLLHQATAPHAEELCDILHYSASEDEVYVAIAHNDVLAAGFARLLLYADAKPMPKREKASADETWSYYVRNWRPGKPHRDTWDAFWSQAKEIAHD